MIFVQVLKSELIWNMSLAFICIGATALFLISNIRASIFVGLHFEHVSVLLWAEIFRSCAVLL